MAENPLHTRNSYSAIILFCTAKVQVFYQSAKFFKKKSHSLQPNGYYFTSKE